MKRAFNLLKREKQLTLICQEGILLAECRRFNYVLRLFALHDFYVELSFLQKEGSIITIHSFKDSKDLDPYLEEIDISSLI
jgi:hypothetical protein